MAVLNEGILLAWPVLFITVPYHIFEILVFTTLVRTIGLSLAIPWLDSLQAPRADSHSLDF